MRADSIRAEKPPTLRMPKVSSEQSSGESNATAWGRLRRSGRGFTFRSRCNMGRNYRGYRHLCGDDLARRSRGVTVHALVSDDARDSRGERSAFGRDATQHGPRPRKFLVRVYDRVGGLLSGRGNHPSRRMGDRVVVRIAHVGSSILAAVVKPVAAFATSLAHPSVEKSA
jgi:hypothetical protein